MSDIWGPRDSRIQRVANTLRTQTPHDLKGRLSQAAPIPVRANSLESSSSSGALFVGPEDPGLDSGFDFWFDTDDVVAP